MGKIRLSGIAPDDYDEYDSLYGGTEKIQRNDKSYFDAAYFKLITALANCSAKKYRINWYNVIS